MQQFTPETEEALKLGRIGLFVFFDFMLLPMRVHSGNGPVDWNGHTWAGVGEVLRQDSCSSPFSMTSGHYNRGHMAASLPINRDTTEVISKGYYRGRRMEWNMCALDGDGGIIERVHHNEGIITECLMSESALNFKAEFDRLDSVDSKDARHKRNVDVIRQGFDWHLSDTMATGWLGWVANIAAAFAEDIVGLIISILCLCAAKNRRAVYQRWQVRKRVYRFTTVPRIPGFPRWQKVYRIRADTVKDATRILYSIAAANIWKFPREYIHMQVYLNGMPYESFNLDYVRKHDNPKRWEETDPMKKWAKKTTA